MSLQGLLLDINVVGCKNLRDTEWLSKQDPYVVLEYSNTKVRTKVHTDGGRNPSFNEKFTFPLFDGLPEVYVQVWNSNTVTSDDLIGSGKIQLQKVISSGYDDSAWPLAAKGGKHAGEIRVIMHIANRNASIATMPPVPMPYAGAQYPMQAGYPPPQAGYPPTGYGPPPGPSMHGSSSNVYPQQPFYPPQVPGYPPQAPGYPPPPGPGYPPSGYPTYPGSLGEIRPGYVGNEKHGKQKHGKYKHKHKHGKFGKDGRRKYKK